jgi:4-hydroxy-3-methylbut-2-enyl diphosphate reductase
MTAKDRSAVSVRLAPVRTTVTAAHDAEVVVAHEIRRSGGPPLSCPAAPLVDAAVRRHGVRTAPGVLTVAEGTAGTAGWTASLPGDRLGFGAAAVAAGVRDVVRSAVASWAAVAGPRTVLLAEPRSFCAGVERAIEVVERALELAGPPVYVRKHVVHNTHVVRDLRERGAVFVEELDEVPEGAVVVFSAHGVSPAVRAEAAARGLDVIDATCPLVTKVHNEALRFAGRGDTVVLIGHAGHEESEGTMGEAPDRTVLVQDRDDVARLRVPDPARVSYLTQTTLAVDEAADVVAALRERFPALRGPKSDDICYATTNRQDSLRVVAGEADLVLVLGSVTSSNSLRLVELARRSGTAAHLVDDLTEIRPEWLAGASTVGVTAGASAPPRLVDETVAALAGLGEVVVERRHVTTETTTFALPPKVRRS